MLVKLVVAHNLAELRKARGLTQNELAQKFNYTDKSISKWEHGETMPDIEVLKQLCDFYGVTLDYLVTEDPDVRATMVKEEVRVANKWTIVALSVSAVWLVAVVVFIFGQIMSMQAGWPKVSWIAFLWAAPVSFIVMLVFNGIWGRALWRTILAILLTWSALACIYVTLGVFIAEGAGWQLWPIFLIGAPLTVASILWNHVLKKPRRPQN